MLIRSFQLVELRRSLLIESQRPQELVIAKSETLRLQCLCTIMKDDDAKPTMRTYQKGV
jgi:hypothetical protein